MALLQKHGQTISPQPFHDVELLPDDRDGSGSRRERSLRLAAVTIGILCSALASCAPEELPRLYQLPETTLTTHDGEDLRVPGDRVAIYDFIFTRCGASCPVLTSRMRDLTLRLDDSAVQYVSVTVDPAYDTPEVLDRYRLQTTTHDGWVFATGERQTIVDFVIDGFKLGIGASEDPREPILHSTKFVLVDTDGWIRGYYDSSDREAINQLERDARRLARRN